MFQARPAVDSIPILEMGRRAHVNKVRRSTPVADTVYWANNPSKNRNSGE